MLIIINIYCYIKSQQYDKARFHIDKVTSCYLGQGWKLPPEIDSWIHEPWLNQTTPNGEADIDYMTMTNAILVEGTDEATAIVTFFDANSKRAAMIYGYKKRLSQKLRLKVGPGVVLKTNYINDPEGKPKILNAVKANFPNNLEYAKVVAGVVSKREDKAFAFLRTDTQDYFISPNVVQKYHVSDGEHLKALVVYDYDKKKESWSWVCISIKK